MNAEPPSVARSLAGLLLLATLLAAGAHIAIYYPRLPVSVASHFDASGRANGWMSRDGFVLMYAGVVALIGVLFAAIALLLRRIPDALINLPHKDHWLDPARREQTLAWLGRWMLWLGVATIAFLIWVMQLTFEANLGGGGGNGGGGGAPALGGAFWFTFGAYMLFVLARSCG